MPNFGVISHRGHGHVATATLIAMIPMLLTAVSYGRMARAYPSAGSAFTYVGREIGPALGYITGWSMVMDYLLSALIGTIWSSQQAHDLIPGIPYWAWVVFFVFSLTCLNIQAVKVSSRVNELLVAALGIVVVAFLAAAARYILSHPYPESPFFIRPFFDPQTWSWNAVLGGTSLAVLSYMGFEGISTLSEEVDKPRDNILLATVLTCVITGVLSVLLSYAAELVWPPSEGYPTVDTAFTFVAQRAWPPLFGILGVALLVAILGGTLGVQLGAARLLYGMGRSGALPRSFFGVIDPQRRVPRNSVLAVGAFALLGAFVLPAVAGKATGFELGASMQNFGALIAFMGVNAAALLHYYWRAENRRLINLVMPASAFLICLLLWWNLSAPARIFGGAWMALGIAWGAWKTRGFKKDLVVFDVPPENSGAN
jgi:putrescine importer